MIKIFDMDTIKRKGKCECGYVFNKDTKQIRVVSNFSRGYGLSYKYVCPLCADKELGKINVELDKAKRSI